MQVSALTALLRGVARSGTEAMTFNNMTKLFDRDRRCPLVQHRVAVWAYGAEISNRINLVFLLDFRERLKVMDVNETFP